MFNTSCYNYFSFGIALVGLTVASVRSAICLTRLTTATIDPKIALAGRPPYSIQRLIASSQ